MAKGNMSAGAGKMQAGMTRKCPPETDASRVCKGGRVDDMPTRSEVGKGHSLGPRTA